MGSMPCFEHRWPKMWVKSRSSLVFTRELVNHAKSLPVDITRHLYALRLVDPPRLLMNCTAALGSNGPGEGKNPLVSQVFGIPWISLKCEILKHN